MRRALACTVCICAMTGMANAAIMTYTDEATFLAAVAGNPTISEGFEGSQWNSVREPTTGNNIMSQGLSWSGSDGVTTGSGWARTGTYGVYDSFGDPDEIYVTSSFTMLGFGGWFTMTTAPSISLSIDGTNVGTHDLTGSHTFFGVIDTDGFTSVAIIAPSSQPSSHWGADDFTIAESTEVPEPTSLALLGMGLAGLGGYRWRRRNASMPA